MKTVEVKTEKKEKTYRVLNNMLNRPENGSIPLHRDKEAVRAYFLEEVNPNTVYFHNLEEKIGYLLDNNYLDSVIVENYSMKEIKNVFRKVYKHKFRFSTFMGANKFYTQYALKTDDGSRWLERYEDRIAFTALYLADGDYDLAKDIAHIMVTRQYQPATPTFLNSGRARRGELVSCFLIQPADSMNDIGRSINSALQLSRIGGGVG